MKKGFQNPTHKERIQSQGFSYGGSGAAAHLEMENGRASCHSLNTRWGNHCKVRCAFNEIECTFHGQPSKGTWSVRGRLLTTHHTAPTKKDPAKGTGGQKEGGR